MTAAVAERTTVKAEHFQKAAQLIKEGGLAKGAYVLPEDGAEKASYCSVGALRTAITGSPYNSSHEVNEAIDFLATEVIGPGGRELCDCGLRGWHYTDGSWPFNVVTEHNDHPDTTQDAVVAMFERAAEKASQR